MNRTGLLAAVVMGLSVATSPLSAQTAPTGRATPGAQPSAGQAAARGPAIPGLNDVVATVSDGKVSDKVTKGEVINFLSRYPLPATENREQVYQDAVDSLVNTKLLTMFLNRQKIAVPPAKVDEEVARLEQQLKAEGQDLNTAIQENNIKLDDIRKELENRIRWSEYVRAKATDAELRRYMANNRDLFSGTQVRASHILLKVDPNASAADKEKVKQKILSIKKDLDENKMTFAEAANKYSEDPANAGGAGGDLDYFTLSSGFITEFTDVAFKLKKGSISEPVETPYGYHLIQVTDRKEGRQPDFEQNKPFIISVYASELQKDLLTEARKSAKIDVKPMPKDLFPPVPAQAPAPAAAKPKAG